MKEDSVNNGKVEVKKVSKKLKKINIEEGFLGELKDEIRKLSKFLFPDDKEIAEWREKSLREIVERYFGVNNKRRRGRPKKDAVYFYFQLIPLVECDEKERIVEYLNTIDKELRNSINECEGCPIERIKDKIKEWVNFAIDLGKTTECKDDTYAESLRNKLLKEMDNLDENTIRRNFIIPAKGIGVHWFETIKRAGKAGNEKEYSRAKGEIAERMMLFWFLRTLRSEGVQYVVIPYFEWHKSSGRRSNRGKLSKGQYYADIAVIDVDNKVVGIIELKNWPGEGKYSWGDYTGENKKKANDVTKWAKTEMDIYKVLEYLATNENIEETLGIKILKKTIKEKESRDMSLLFDLGAGTFEEWLNIFEERGQNNEELIKKEFEEIVIHIREAAKYVLNGIKKHPEIKPNEFRIVKFWVMFTGRLKEDGTITRGRRLDRGILRDFERRDVIYIQMKPTLNIDKWESWKASKFVTRVILEIMRNHSLVEAIEKDAGIVNTAVEYEDGNAKVIEIEWKTLPYKCTIRIPKTLRWET